MIGPYSFGKIKVNGVHYTKDLLVFPDIVVPGWRRKSGHLLRSSDICSVLDYRPEVLIVGTGALGFLKVDKSLKEKLKKQDTKLIIKNTPDAITEYNQLYKEKRTVCALHLTC
jgi:hypothetical protein